MLRVEAVELGAFDQRLDRGGAAAAGIGAGKQIILAANRDEALIVPPFFKCLETLKVDFGDQCDTGDLFAQ